MTRQAVVAHAGARDHFQLALALHEQGFLDRLVTDVYVAPGIVRGLAGLHLDRLTQAGARRSEPGLPGARVTVAPGAFVAWALGAMTGRPARNWDAGDISVSLAAARAARSSGAALYLYSYYAFEAFRGTGERDVPKILFQLHPHPLACKAILQREMAEVPAAATNIAREREMLASESELARLAAEPELADHVVVASSFSKATLVANGIGEDKITVVPYGVDADAFPRRLVPRQGSGPLRIAFLGSFAQRKGVSYLLDAIRAFRKDQVELVVITRFPPDADLVGKLPENVSFATGVGDAALPQMLHSCDAFILPSLIEGFGHSILEAMASGLPVIATDHTCAADLIEHGTNGFSIPVRDPAAIRDAIDACLDRRAELFAMGQAAADVAAQLTWPRFRSRIADDYRGFMDRRSIG